MKTIHIPVGNKTWQTFRMACLREGIPLVQKIRDLIENFLQEKEGRE